MADDYPYMVSNNKILPILNKIEKAEKPTKFSHSFLKKLGFASSNDRAIIPLLKRLEFLTESGVPTQYYDDLKDSTKRFFSLGDRIRSLYSELFSINTKINEASDEEIKGAISRVTGKDAKSVDRYFYTFNALIKIAKFTLPSVDKKDKKSPKEIVTPPVILDDKSKTKKMDFIYNIQIQLPATTDISVYNAIFKSLKDNLNL